MFSIRRLFPLQAESELSARLPLTASEFASCFLNDNGRLPAVWALEKLFESLEAAEGPRTAAPATLVRLVTARWPQGKNQWKGATDAPACSPVKEERELCSRESPVQDCFRRKRYAMWITTCAVHWRECARIRHISNCSKPGATFESVILTIKTSGHTSKCIRSVLILHW